MSFGVDPRNPLEYSKIPFYICPMIKLNREPISGVGGDYAFQLNTICRVSKNEDGSAPLTGVEGDQWMLIKKQGAPSTATQNPTWVKFMPGGSNLLFSLSDQSNTVEYPSAPGDTPPNNIQLLGAAIANAGVPLASAATGLNRIDLNIQVAKARMGAPADKADAGICSFDDTQFTVTGDGYVSLMGGGMAIDSITVDTATAPGVNPVAPDGAGNITVTGLAVANAGVPIQTHTVNVNQYNIELQVTKARTGAPADKLDAGAASFDDTAFQADANGYVQLKNGGAATESVTVDAATAPGVNPVTPSALGTITVTGSQVATGQAGTQGVRTHTTALNEYDIEIQQSTTAAAKNTQLNGLSHYDQRFFTVDEGYVSFTGGSTGATEEFSNLGMKYNAGTGTFTILASDGTDLSATNPAYVRIQSRANPGLTVLHSITANQDFIDDAGASEIIGALFGFTTGVAITVDVPFFVYAVVKDDDTTVKFMISRIPCFTTSPSSAEIGSPGSAAAASTNYGMFSLDAITATDYDSNPCLCIGSFRMQMSAADDWTVQTLAITDGFGMYQLETKFEVPKGQFGANSGTWSIDNGGTAPVFSDYTTNYYRFFSKRGNTIRQSFEMTSTVTSTAGAGAVTAKITTPFYPTGSGSGASGACPGTGRMYNNGTEFLIFPGYSTTTNNLSFRDGTAPSTFLQWGDFPTNNVEKVLSGNVTIPVFRY